MHVDFSTTCRLPAPAATCAKNRSRVARHTLSRLAIAALLLLAASRLTAADKDGVTLKIDAASAQRLSSGEILFECKLTLENRTCADLKVLSGFYSELDGLELLVIDPDGKLLKRQGYIYHQSPYSPSPREFTLRKGKSQYTIVFPIRELTASAFKVQLAGTLPGSAYPFALKSGTIAVELPPADKSKP